jgi:hypothetical protein
MAIQSPPKIRKSSIGIVDFTKEREWLTQNAQRYMNEWVVLHQDRLIGHGLDPRPIVAQARAEGIRIPFVHFVHEETEPFMGGWV